MQDMQTDIIQAGQSQVKPFYCQNAGKTFVAKRFYQHDDYVREKLFYSQILQGFQMNDQSSFLTLLGFNDDSKELIFPFVRYNLLEYIRQQQPLSFEQIMYSFSQVLESLKLLHDNNISHCDLKDLNILLNVESNLHHILIDFGHYQKIQKGEMSQLPCGTIEFNPPQFNNSIYEYQKYKKPIQPYCPYQLDIYQLGILLFRMTTFIELDDKSKEMAQKQKNKQVFKIIIEKKYLEQKKRQLDWSDQLFELIFQLLSGEINDINQLCQNKLVSEFMNIKKNDQSFQVEECIQMNKDESSSRGSGGSTEFLVSKAFKTYTDLMDDIENSKFVDSQQRFFKQSPRTVQQHELLEGSLFAEMSAQDLLKVLLNILAQNNPDIFGQNIFTKTDNLTLEAELVYESTEIAIQDDFENLINSIEDGDEEEIEKLIQTQKVLQKVKMSIEIVNVEYEQREMRSLIFQLIEGSSIYYINLVSQIKQQISQF